jgi:peptide/nickel transport system permease protein
MRGFLLNRLSQSLVLLLVVSIIGFVVLNLLPGGPLAQFGLDPGMTQDDLDRLKEQLGLNRPLLMQYLDWAWRLLQGDWGHSFRDGVPVLTVIGRHVFATLLLMGTSTAIAIAIGTWIGIRGATHRYSLFDHVATVGAMVALSIPTFWFGLVGIYIFSLRLGWLPAGNMYTIGDGSVLNYLHHLILPSIVLSLVHVAIWSRYMRTATLDAISQDFVKTARAKGLSAASQHPDRRAGDGDSVYLAGDGSTVLGQPRLQRLPGRDGTADVLSHPCHPGQPDRRHRGGDRRSAHSSGLSA